MKYFEDWWTEDCYPCGLKAEFCECREDWEERHGEGSIPKWWGWHIAPKDFECAYCGGMPSTYDCCCAKMDAYLRYRYAVVFFPEIVDELHERDDIGDLAA